MAIQSDTAALLSRSSAELPAQGWEKPPSLHVWGECGGARKGPVVLRSDLCRVIRGAAGKFAPVETASLNVP